VAEWFAPELALHPKIVSLEEVPVAAQEAKERERSPESEEKRV
jgi:hypothetical protein